MKHAVLQLYDYHVWANAKVFEHLKGLPKDLWRQEVQSVFPSVNQVLVHICVVDQTWLRAMAGDSFEQVAADAPGLYEEAIGKSLEGLEQLYAEVARRYQGFFEEHPDLDAVLSLPHPRHGALQASPAEIVQHVVNHGTYHRGNLTAMLRQLGHPGVPTDYVFYLYSLNR